MKQLIYILSENKIFCKINENEESLHIVFNNTEFSKNIFKIYRVLGFKDFIKFGLKFLLGDKAIYFYSEEKAILSYGIITFGYCKLYPVGKKDAVIGPINTLKKAEGRGLATKSIKFAVNTIFRIKKCENIYIDTSEKNFTMQHIILKVGFNGPIEKIDKNNF